MTTELCNHIAMTINNSGSCLLPVYFPPFFLTFLIILSYSCGLVLDLIEQVHTFLGTIGKHSVPIYFVSAISDYVLAYSNISTEW